MRHHRGIAHPSIPNQPSIWLVLRFYSADRIMHIGSLIIKIKKKHYEGDRKRECVCERKREREKETERERKRERGKIGSGREFF